MKKGCLVILITALSVPLFCVSASASGGEEEIPRITKEGLRSMLGSPGVVVIDVRGESSWNASTAKIEGAVWESRKDVASWSEKYLEEQTLVLY